MGLEIDAVPEAEMDRKPILRSVGSTWPMPSLTYVICTSPQSGGTLLAEGLAATGLAGRPAGYFDVMCPTKATGFITMPVRAVLGPPQREGLAMMAPEELAHLEPQA